MPTNPLYNTNDSPNNSTQPSKAVNRQGVFVPRTHNKFDNSYFHYKTQKFGQYEPFFVMEGVAGDTIPLHSSHNVRSLPMSSPFLSQLTLNKDYFMIPMQAILPNTWEYIFKNPTQGDDVPDDANCIMRSVYWNDGSICFLDYLLRYSLKASNDIRKKFRNLFTLELFLSQGSLLQQLGYHLNPRFTLKDNSVVSFDTLFDAIIRSIKKLHISVIIGDEVQELSYDESTIYSNNASVAQCLNYIRTYGSLCTINLVEFNTNNYTSFFTYDGLPQIIDEFQPTGVINLQRLFAYQLCCSQYYVNPQVDYLYNAQLYRDNLFTLWSDIMTRAYGGAQVSPKFFNYNGIKIPYDYTSQAYLDSVINLLIEDDYDAVVDQVYDYLYAIFGHRESLRFGDYFTDSRTRPLAIGDNYVGVSTEGVDVIDMSKSIIYQRFRNAVVKLGNNFGDYLRGIYGTDPSPDYHYPKYIVHGEFDINGFEVANTYIPDLQGQMVTNLRSGDDTFAFEVSVDMPCILIGISYFSVPRVYMQSKDRHFFHRDRYDMFNPMLQNIGDQIVYNNERTDLRPLDEIFGYQSRNNEYKQRVSIVSGAFSTLLPAWTFVADSLFTPLDDIAIVNTQSPEYLRSHDYEFNRFFRQMPGFSLANSFHFIVVYNNKCESVRPMEINPSTL